MTHIPKISNDRKATMNGIIYAEITKDIASTESYALSAGQKHKALQETIAFYQKNHSTSSAFIQQQSAKAIIFVDDNHKAHYAYLISFVVNDLQNARHKPTFIVDATSLKIYREWDRIKYITNAVTAGGIGGNDKTGPLIYDGDKNHLPGLTMLHHYYEYLSNLGEKITMSDCSLQNKDVEVKDVAYSNQIVNNKCFSRKDYHNQVFWLSWDHHETRWKSDEVNGGYSPSLDVLYGATVVKNLFQDWYGMPVLVDEDGHPRKLVMEVHFGRNVQGAFTDSESMTFGDGGKEFYPFTSLDVVAHEIGHAFTEQHSFIDSTSLQVGALHEAFSDMTAIAAQYYINGKTTWDIGRSIKKGEGAIRYFEDPTKDGNSIDHMKDFEEMNIHYLAGIFNKAFYLIANSPGWDVQKAYNIMVKANMHYWTANMNTFQEAMCGVLLAAKDYEYDISHVKIAFTQVGLDVNKC